MKTEKLMDNEGQFGNLVKTKMSNLLSDFLVTSSRPWLEAGDVMSKDVVTSSSDATVLSAAKMMYQKGISCITVVDQGSLVGILTETDFLKRVAGKDKDFDKLRVGEIMSCPVHSAASDLSVIEAGRIMSEKKIKRLPILEAERLVGIVTQTDMIRVLTSYGMWRDVAEIMSTDVAGIQTEATVAQAAEIMTDRGISCIVVLGQDEVVGVMTERDLLKRVIAQQKNPSLVQIGKVMSSPVTKIPSHYSVFSAGRIMDKMHVRRLVVMDDARLCGIVTQTDIFRAVKNRLQDEEEKNFQLLENSASSIYTVDLEGNTTYVNPAFMKLLEVPDRREFIGQPFLPERFWLNPQDRTRFLKGRKNGSVEIRELALKTAKGRTTYVTLFSTFTKNLRGQINGSQGMLYDITAKKELVALRETQEALRESEEKLRTILEGVHDVIFQISPLGFIQYVSPNVQELYGYQPADLVGKHFEKTTPPNEVPMVSEKVETVLAGETVKNFELNQLDSKGQAIPMEINASPLKRHDKVVAVQGVMRDISARKRAETALRIRDWAIKSSLNAIALADLNGNLTYVNPSFLKMWEYDPDEVLGKPVEAFWQVEEKVAQVLAVVHEKGGWTGELVAKRKGGSTFDVYLSVSIVKDECGKPICMMASFTDISDGKRARENLRQAKDQAEKARAELEEVNLQLEASVERARVLAQQAEAANRTKSQFLASVSHEIRTPMNAIIGFSEVLGEAKLTDEQRGYINIIRESGENLLQLINDILDFSKIEAGKLDVEIVDCCLEQLFAVVESMMRPQAKSKGLAFEILQCGELPAQIRTDTGRLRQCLVNLIDNAIKFTEQGHVYVNVSLREQDGKPYIRFDVEDTGIGIPLDKQELIFEVFAQAEDSTTRKYGGTGLGLAITRQLAHLLGGELSLTSEQGEGSVFSLIIPTGVEVESQPRFDRYDFVNTLYQDLPAGGGPGTTGPVKFQGRVLVAEDSQTSKVLIRLLLEQLGLDVAMAQDGREAVDKALKEDFDMIFMDIQMPNMNGYDATRILREREVKTPIVALTAYVMKGDEQKCTAAGCNDYLAKPIDREKLQQTIGKYLPLQQRGTLSDRIDTVKVEVDELSRLYSDEESSRKEPRG